MLSQTKSLYFVDKDISVQVCAFGNDAGIALLQHLSQFLLPKKVANHVLPVHMFRQKPDSSSSSISFLLDLFNNNP